MKRIASRPDSWSIGELAKATGVSTGRLRQTLATIQRVAIRFEAISDTMMFSEGNFEVQMLVHEKTPPGSKVCSSLRRRSYEFKETERGAVIQITTTNKQGPASNSPVSKIPDQRTPDGRSAGG